MKARRLCVWLSLSLVALATGAAPPSGPAAPQVEVVQPVVREVIDYADFTGRTEASATVAIKARVSGYLNKVLFKEGAKVKKGDLLFEIDPRPYKADLEKAEAALALSESRLKRVEGLYKRARAKADLSAAELARAAADHDEAAAQVRLAKATRIAARLKLDYTKVAAPIDGRIDRRRLDPGSLVRADDTTLTTIIARNPMYVSFKLDRQTALKLLKAKKEGKANWAVKPQVEVALTGEKTGPWRGKVDFIAGRLDPKTEMLSVRAVLCAENELLVPGLFVRVRLLMSDPHKALLVPLRALTPPKSPFRDGKGAMVINEKNKIKWVRIEAGLPHGELIEVKKGLGTRNWVVLEWSEFDEGMTVKPKKVAMPLEKK